MVVLCCLFFILFVLVVEKLFTASNWTLDTFTWNKY
jgi:hypothetical protein